ncbi:hypothetical protein V2J09_002459 [Rumex salicifolius]
MAKEKMSMKLLIDKSKRKVLFAEAGKECVDFLFHILSLPLGSVVGFLTKESMAGSIGSLYGSLEGLGDDFVQLGIKNCLLNPKPASGSASNIPMLTIKQAADDAATKTYYTCNQNHRYITDGFGALCPHCNVCMSTGITYVAPTVAAAKKQGESGVGGYVKGVVTYMIMDDLSVQPMSTISGITLLNKFNIQDVGHLEEKLVTIDMNLALSLLKASLTSKTVLTDAFLPKRSASAKIKMKLLIDKGKHKVLFAEAGKDCVDFLFHILSLPLSTIIGFLTTESIPSGISSLYKSLENLSTDYLQEGINKDNLLNPKPTPGSSSINVPLLTIDKATDDPAASSKTLYTCAGSSNYDYYDKNVHPYVCFSRGVKCPSCKRGMNTILTVVPAPAADIAKAEGGGGYVKGVVTYMIMDDLSVQPMSMVSSIALLNKFNVQDVACLKEREVTLDMSLGLALLKASLMSNTVLTDVFVVKKLDID